MNQLSRRRIWQGLLSTCWGATLLVAPLRAAPLPAQDLETDVSRSARNECPAPGDPEATIKPLSDIRVALPKDSGELPQDCTTNMFSGQPAPSSLQVGTQFQWQPTNLFHQPLYFDDQPLERYGQTRHPLLQPLASGVKFFGTFPIVPYKMGFNGTHDCVTPMGYHQPGSCAPCVRERYPFTWKGALLEAGVATGMAVGLP